MRTNNPEEVQFQLRKVPLRWMKMAQAVVFSDAEHRPAGGFNVLAC